MQKYYHWQLIEADPDDNKFIDCAIAASAELLVSHDGHFRVINQYPYLNIKLLSAATFQSLIG